MIKGRKIALTPEFIVDVIDFPNEGVERYFSHKELMGGRSGGMDVSKKDVANCVLLSDISQMIVPKAGKSNVLTHLETFYCWCILHAIPLNLPFIILNHMLLPWGTRRLSFPMVLSSPLLPRKEMCLWMCMLLPLHLNRVSTIAYCSKIWGLSSLIRVGFESRNLIVMRTLDLEKVRERLVPP